MSVTTGRLSYRVDEAAALLGVSETTVRQALDRGDLRSVRFGKCVVIPADALDEVLGIERPVPADPRLVEAVAGVMKEASGLIDKATRLLAGGPQQ